MSRLTCDRRIAARIKEKVYFMIVRPATMYGLEMLILTKGGRAGGSIVVVKTFH